MSAVSSGSWVTVTNDDAPGWGDGMSGTKVTCTDVDTGESESAVIVNDYIVICDGDRYLDHVQQYANGTVVLTIKRRP